MKKTYWLLMLLLGVLLAPPSWAQTTARAVSGIVTSSTDQSPLPGVTVLVKGTTNGSTTGADGRYSVQAAPGTTLVFSFIGYASQERTVPADGAVDVALKESTTDLNEVVVTSYGIPQAKRELVTAVQEVKSKDIIDSRQTNVVNALQGKIAGVNITSSGGSPGEGASIVIRGGTSLDGDNQPLFVIDGMIMDNGSFQESTAPGGGSAFNGLLGRSVGSANRAGDLNPEDIESITVLKGPAAAALYGLRAAGGAVVITTKKGKAGTTTLNYRTQYSVDEVSRLPKMQSLYKRGSNGLADPTTRISFGPRFAPDETVYDNVNAFFRKGNTWQNFLNLSGGSEKASFFVSASNLQQQGVTPGSKYDKSTVRLSGTAEISSRLQVSGSAQYLTSGAERPIQGPGLFGSSGGFLLSLLNWPRDDDATNYLNPDGTRRRLLALGNGTDSDADNPFWTVNNNPQTDRTNRFIGNVRLSFKVANWLTLSHNLGTDVYTSRITSVRAVGTSQVGNQNGGIAETVDQFRLTTATTLASFSHNFSDNIGGSLVLGNTLEENRDEAVDYIGLIFQNPNFVGLNNTVNRSALQRDSKRHLIGNFARVNLSLFNQVFLELQGRYDQSSTLPRPDEGKIFGKGFFYGSVGAGYEFTKTLGLENSNIVNYGKLRASVAGVGKDAPPYRVLAPLTQNTYIGGGFRNDFFGSNPNLRPENTRTYEAGINLQFLKNRLGLDFNYYYSRTKDQIIAPRVSQAAGFILQYINGGIVTNEGQEVSLTGTPVKAKNFTWDIVANFYHNTNRVEELPFPLTVVYQSDAFITDVHEGGAFPGRPISGLGASDFNRVTDPSSEFYGQMIINSATGYPTVNPLFVYAGNRAPRFTTQLTNTFTYKGLSLTSLMDFRVGGVVINGNDWYQTRVGTSERTADRYKQVVFDGVIRNTDGTYSKNTRPVELTQTYYTSILGAAGTAFVEDGSWARLRYVTLSYALPASLLSRTGFIKGAELSVTGRNLVLLTKYSGADPETSSAGAGVRGGGANGFDYGNVPATRGVDMALRVNF
ncbi:SusC/RagA family TonB-linked outer membrane protein [Hymenobacter properus]|uniref:SusC/RagA family TonB-linked outer membrane protein n=1 Tax=Hymenobacter properus TaxID=2791026 RepID=A0A931BMV5_9BACT|nr:SusC/RagA family TonB-linked outer membrane protein [Hymenobacter properus]MBF9142330.1 SusC/RagA family TonB-linked outer membrane protein [Hymenobacter properus]MBR7721137.1 SusC/RagA family TonB-linked outer membrane protein [Microvirga sp. SRT04]